MHSTGPALEVLIRRLVETPADFLLEPRIGERGDVFVAALVNDLLGSHGHRVDAATLARFTSNDASADRNRLALAMIAVWLLAQDWFASQPLPRDTLLQVLDGAVADLAATTAAHKFVTDPDRREELARAALARLGFRPHGETVPQATDRLSAISGTERKRLLEASRAAERRARELREALAKKAAEESADKWSRD